MNRNDLVQMLAERVSVRPREARKILDVLFGTPDGTGLIADALDRGERVSIAGFGTFTVRERRERLLRDPRTGEPRRVAPRRAPVFRPGVGLRDRVR
jgi:DNA-binding protein HU-beta